MNFNPLAFVENLKYMGQGMLGVFVSVAIIVIVAVVLNKVTKN